MITLNTIQNLSLPTKSKTPLTTFLLYFSLGNIASSIWTVAYGSPVTTLKSFIIDISASVHEGRQLQYKPGRNDQLAFNT